MRTKRSNPIAEMMGLFMNSISSSSLGGLGWTAGAPGAGGYASGVAANLAWSCL
jgi:hypothetical protein